MGMIENFLLLTWGAAVVLFFIVWVWAIWIAFTRGDDCFTRFGKSVSSGLRRLFGTEMQYEK